MEKKVCQRSTVDKNVFQAKELNQMIGDDIKNHFHSSGVEFSSKMEENFKCYVLIAASSGMQSLDVVLQMMTYLSGYQMHKTVGCSERIYHLYVKYEVEAIAIAARDFFRSEHFNAEIVDDMLRLWYAFEKMYGHPMCPTNACLATSNGSYISSKSATEVLKRYGNPEIKVIEDECVKVSFSSIAEAFGASIALGPWFYNNSLIDSNYYSSKIELSNYCSRIMRMCNMTDVASEFDYFVQNDSYVKAKTNVLSDSNEIESDQTIPVLKETELNQLVEVKAHNPDQPLKALQNRSGNKPYRIVQKNRSSVRFYRRQNNENKYPHQMY